MATAPSCGTAADESTFRPVPTEYKGTVYRSKCEAMFARWLEIQDEWCTLTESYCRDNSHGSGRGFIYEPKGTSVEGWTPDFLRWRVTAIHAQHPWQSPILVREIVEYKPSRPTGSYLEAFANKCEKLNPILTERSSGRIDYCLYFGSVFNEDRGCFCVFLKSDGGHEISYRKHDWLACDEQLVRETRFDLEAR